MELGESVLAALDRIAPERWPPLSELTQNLIIERDTAAALEEPHAPRPLWAQQAEVSPAYDLAGERRGLRAWGGGTDDRAHDDRGDDAI